MQWFSFQAGKRSKKYQLINLIITPVKLQLIIDNTGSTILYQHTGVQKIIQMVKNQNVLLS
jgi:hypothetical protein